MKRIIEKLKHILVVPDTFDPDDLRRRQVLNGALLLWVVLIVIQAIGTFANDNLVLLLRGEAYAEEFRILVTDIAGLLLGACLLVLNRSSRMPKNLVGWIFVMGTVALVSISDSRAELVNGRSIFLWAIPVALSVVVLPPASVLVVDLFITAAFIYYSGFRGSTFQVYTLFEIYMVSFLSWLGMSIAERAIRDARNESKKNAAILEGVAEGVIVLGPNYQVILTNQAASELIGAELNRIAPTLENAEINGRALSFHWSKVEGVGWVAIVRDISRQIEIDHAKDAILRVVSHEMRTPLAAILGFAELLEMKPVPGLAARIQANGQRLLKLVDDLLDVAQIQAGALIIHKETFSLVTLRSYILESFMKLAEAKGVVLDVHDTPAFSEQVTGDLQRLEQVVANLVGNAIKFTDKGGRVDVSFCVQNGTGWQITVKDTGVGIPPERLSDIFEPFRRASDYTRRKHQGVGLGLSIARKIVQLSGGDISVASAVGAGSTFRVSLPRT